MNYLKYFSFIFFGFYPLIAHSITFEAEVSRDYYLYRQRKGIPHQAIEYVQDINTRIEEQTSKGNKMAFGYLTSLLNYVLVTGGPFKIEQRAPTKHEQEVFSTSVSYISSLAKLITLAKPEQSLANTLEEIVYCSTQSDDPLRKTKINPNQFNSLLSLTNDVLKESNNTIYRETVKKFQTGPSKKSTDDDWYSFKDGKVIIHDIARGHSYYLLDTAADGACWMHAMAGSNDQEFTCRGFIKKLLSLDNQKRTEVCEYGFYLFCEMLAEEYESLFKKFPTLLGQFKKKIRSILIPYESHNFNREALVQEDYNEILQFICNEEVFKILVNRKAAENNGGSFIKGPADSLLNSAGANKWNSFDSSVMYYRKGKECEVIEWPRIWAFVYGYNIGKIGYRKAHPNVRKDLSFASRCYSSSKPWSFHYFGSDIHVSALHPVGACDLNLKLKYATPSYFSTWHKNLNPEERENCDNAEKWYPEHSYKSFISKKLF